MRTRRIWFTCPSSRRGIEFSVKCQQRRGEVDRIQRPQLRRPRLGCPIEHRRVDHDDLPSPNEGQNRRARGSSRSRGSQALYANERAGDRLFGLPPFRQSPLIRPRRFEATPKRPRKQSPVPLTLLQK